ncbi:hypothetical protein N0V88_000823 [Collariella sp. IMI 366227]|nr:hypothetical protein N0V88_000823 [Collariella sp. IMI 366227]
MCLFSLHNISKHEPTTPLVIYIPPFSQLDPEHINPPSCFEDYPTAVINYRWQAVKGDDRPEIPLYWPTPLHDVSFGYSWIAANLGSGSDGSAAPRPAYLYGSYLGAGLAASLAMTEAHSPMRGMPMTIRGLIAHNGIYNWTMFLPDHPLHNFKPPKPRGRPRLHPLPLPDENPVPIEEEGLFTELKDQTPGLFSNASNLFDPFASPCLFFHSPNLHIPDDFTTPLTPNTTFSDEFSAAVDALANSSPSAASTSHGSSPRQLQTPPPPLHPSTPTEPETATTLLAAATALAKQLKPPQGLPRLPRATPRSASPTLFLYDRPWNYFLLPPRTRQQQRSCTPARPARQHEQEQL